MASILDEFDARTRASADSWHYIVGALGFNVAVNRTLTPDEILDILRKAERFGSESLTRKGVADNRQSVDEYIAQLRERESVS